MLWRYATSRLALVAARAFVALVGGLRGSTLRGQLRRPAPRLRKGAGRLAARRWPLCTGKQNELLPGGTDAFERRIAALGLPGRRQRLGLLVRALPRRVPGPAEALGEVRQAGRLPRRQLRRLRSSRDDLSQGGTGPLPQLLRPRARRSPARSTSRSGFPTPPFLTARGQLVYLKQGPYAHASDLEADLKHYALAEANADKR